MEAAVAHKIRESLMKQRNVDPLSGEVHMDGAYVNGYIRPQNEKEDRIDHRLAEHQRPDKRCVFVMRQKSTGADVDGASKTLTFILKGENQIDFGNLAHSFVKKARSSAPMNPTLTMRCMPNSTHAV